LWHHPFCHRHALASAVAVVVVAVAVAVAVAVVAVLECAAEVADGATPEETCAVEQSYPSERRRR
jgi:phosphosulfolactate phosphohydrolase-like enzyme